MPSSPMAMEAKKKDGKPDKWEIDNWTDTIVRAMEILNDPAKMKHVKKAMSDKQESIMCFDDLAKKIEAG